MCWSYVHVAQQTCVRRRCTSVVIFVQSIMLMFAPSYLMFKTIAEHTADIASEYKLTHRKGCELSAESPDITTHTLKFQEIFEYNGLLDLFDYFFHDELFLVVRSLLDVLRFLHNDFQWRGTNKLCFTSLIVTHHFLFTLCMYFVYFWVVAINIGWFDLIWLTFSCYNITCRMFCDHSAATQCVTFRNGWNSSDVRRCLLVKQKKLV